MLIFEGASEKLIYIAAKRRVINQLLFQCNALAWSIKLMVFDSNSTHLHKMVNPRLWTFEIKLSRYIIHVVRLKKNVDHFQLNG